MKKIVFLIIVFLTLTIGNHANAQIAGAAAPGFDPCGGTTITGTFNLVFDHGHIAAFPVQYSATVDFQGGDFASNLVTEMLGQPNPYLIIDGTAFNNQYPCFTLGYVTVYIEVFKRVVGESDWTMIQYGTATVNDIFYFDYPTRSKTVNVTLQNVEGLN